MTNTTVLDGKEAAGRAAEVGQADFGGGPPLGRIVGLMGVFGMALILGVSAYLLVAESRRLDLNERADMRSTAFFLADHAARLFEVASIALDGTAKAVEGTDWAADESSFALYKQLRATADAVPHIDDVWLNDARGQLRVTSFSFPAPRSDASDRTSFKEASTGRDGIIIGDLILGRVTNKRTFLIAKRLLDTASRFNGMVSVTADLAYFSEYWGKVGGTQARRISLVRAGTGEVLVQWPTGANGEVGGIPPAIWTSIEKAGEQGVVLERDGFYAASHGVPGLPLHIVVEATGNEADRDWRSFLNTLLPLSLIGVGAFGVLTLVGFRQAKRDESGRTSLEKARLALADANGNLEAIVSERTAELIESNEEIQRFAYLVSHDLRAPLVNIMGFTSELEALRSDIRARLLPPVPEAAGTVTAPALDDLLRDFDESIDFIKSSISKMDRLINAILVLSREGRRRFKPEQVDLGQLLKTITDALAHQAQEANATISIGPMPTITSDRLALEQVLGNLIDNAIKYLRNGVPGRIDVTSRETGGALFIRVRDNGRGIESKDSKRVFELFRRSGAQDRPGEGIGLAHVRALVRRLGGDVTMRSEFGEGAEFTVRLPAKWKEADE